MRSKRNRQVADQIHREIALIVKNEISDPRLSEVMVSYVDLSPDLGNARVFYTLTDEVKKNDAQLALKKALGFIRYQLSARTKLRYTPNIRFQYDESIDRARHIMSLINDVDDE